jgi:RNA polymerase sigma-70 factor (family 1)
VLNNLHTYNEQELILLLQKGDESAFEKIYALYSQRLLGALIKLVKSESLACELLQDVFIRVWNNREQVDPTKSFKSYLFRIAENLAYDLFRKTARDKRLQEELITQTCSYYNHVEEDLSNKENTQALQHLIIALPPQRRKIFSLVKLEGKTYAEVSELLNISPSTINDHVVKATKFIREQMCNSESLAISPLIFVLFF